jgi:hypothetical protein
MEDEYMNTKKWFFLENDKTSMIVHDTTANIDKKIHLDWTSCSEPYELISDLLHLKGILDKPCVKCGRIVGTNYADELKKELIRDNICFDCHYWNRYVTRKDDYDVVRVNGEHYVIVRHNIRARLKSFRGSRGHTFRSPKFKIRFYDGREVISRNLWYQGVIPERFKFELPDNAIFM